MKIEFIFDKEKLKKENLTEEECLSRVRKYFNDNKSDTIKEIKPGFFIGEEKDWSIFGWSVEFFATDWFLKVIKEWYLYVDEGDGLGEQKEDFLEAYYSIMG